MISRFKNIILPVLVMCAANAGMHARTVNVHGVVTAKHSGEPLAGVCVFNAATNGLLGSTNNDGKYMVSVDDGAELEFRILGSLDKLVPVEGRLKIDVELEREQMTLNEVVVQAKRVTNNILTEPTDMDVKGNYLHIKTHVKMPHELFSSSSRLIIQPMVYNVTRKQISYLSPIVYDGWRYAVTQERIYDFDKNADPLSKEVEVKRTSGRKDDVLTIIDSAYVEHPKDDFRCDLMLSIENYNRIVYSDTSTIARGVVNPLRFLELDIPPVYVEDSLYLPSPDLQLRDAGGDVKLTFKVGQDKLDLDLADNRSEMNALLEQLQAIQNDPNATLKSFNIAGTASPEGGYNFNLRLARRRMESAMGLIYDNLDANTRKNAKLTSDADVEQWSSVAKMLRADSLMDEADAIEDIVAQYPDNRDRQSQRVTRLPFYKLLKDTYLPRLRRVSYHFVSSRYRYLTDEEIADLYRKNSAGLSTYEYWRLYSLCDSLHEKEEIARNAMKAHPAFLVGASDLTAMMLARDEADSSILAPLMEKAGERVPDEARHTLAGVYLKEGNFVGADSLASLLPDIPRYHKTIVYSKALNGHIEEVMQELSAESPLNEVLMLLAVKANDLAWEKAKKLGNTAREEYVKAIAANRMDDYLQAIDHLEASFRLDPSLRDIARVDGDVIDLLDEENN